MGLPQMSSRPLQELRLFLDRNRDHRHWPIWYLAVNTGMRRGELVGLRWRDVDLDDNRLSVRNTILSVGYEIQQSEPKTKRGNRTIDLDDRTVSILSDHRQAQNVERSIVDLRGHAELVFAKPDGAPYHPDHVRQAFDRRVARTAVPRIRFYDYADLRVMPTLAPLLSGTGGCR